MQQAAAERMVVLASFPSEVWPSLPRERYALGGGKDTWCYLMEFGTPELGGIGGGSARKHLIYRRASDGSWYYDRRFDSVEQTWDRVRAGFVKVFEMAAGGDLSSVWSVEPTNWAPSLVGKSVFTYFPDLLVPIYSHAHQQHFWELLGGDGEVPWSASGGAALLQLARQHPGLAELSPHEIALFLYDWAPPWFARRVLKIAPGPNAEKWADCRDGGYICVEWDGVGNLAEFDQKDEFRARFREVYKPYYQTESKLSAKANEVWALRELEPGDRVIANRGTSHVLAVGTVEDPGYEWRPDRPDYKHTVRVKWDESYAQDLNPTVKAWATVTVARVTNEVWERIEGGKVGEVRQPRGPERPRPPADPTFDEITAALGRKGQVILYGPPGTGKTYTASRYLEWLLWGVDQRPRDPGGVGLVTRVTFHPSYTYEDFVEGYRPAAAGSGGLVLHLQDGVLKRVCTAAAQDPGRTFFLLIDEINRGNIPRIFGELITLLELDKRKDAVTLPQSGQEFRVPMNVRIIGTMNTADRSIKLLDAALRRRFAFIELLPEPDLLAGAVVDGLALDEFLETLNRRVAVHAGREKQIGHSYLMQPDGQGVTDPDEFTRRFRLEILPLLQEYAYEDYTRLEEYVGKGIVDRAEMRIRADVVANPAQLIGALRESFMPAGSAVEGLLDPS